MTKHNPESVDELYRYGRSYPNGDGPKGAPAKASNPPGWELDPKRNSPAIQNREDQQDASYDNRTSGWVRGEGKQSPHPHFDRTKAGR